LESNPELNKKVSEKFERNFLEIVSDAEKFNLLLEKLGTAEMQKLAEIQKKYDSKEYNEKVAKDESEKVIEHYTRAKLSVLKANI
jgi:hypothetical protein